MEDLISRKQLLKWLESEKQSDDCVIRAIIGAVICYVAAMPGADLEDTDRELISKKELLAWLQKYRSSSSALLRTVINTIIHYVEAMPQAELTHS